MRTSVEQIVGRGEPGLSGRPFGLLGEAAMARVRDEADRLLERVGIEIRGHPGARERLAAAGARVDGERVRFEPGLARALVTASAPRSFVQRARNPAHDVAFGTGATVTAPATGPPMVRGRDGARRYGTLADYEDFARLVQACDAIDHAGGGYCEAVDRGAAVRDLHALAASLRHTDKAVMGHARDPQQVRDSLALAGVAFGDGLEGRDCRLLNLFNVESPLVLTGETVEGMRLTAESGQASLVTAYAILGMNAPVTCGPALAVMRAEIEAAIALVQVFAPGAPVIAGCYGTPFSMSAMRPAFGSIEGMMLMAAGAQLAHDLGCPVRGDGTVTSAKLPDGQAAADAARGITTARAAGVDFALQSAGWLEAGLVMSLDKFMLDVAVIEAARASSGGETARAPFPVRDPRALLAAAGPPPIEAALANELDRYVAEAVQARRVN